MVRGRKPQSQEAKPRKRKAQPQATITQFFESSEKFEILDTIRLLGEDENPIPQDANPIDQKSPTTPAATTPHRIEYRPLEVSAPRLLDSDREQVVPNLAKAKKVPKLTEFFPVRRSIRKTKKLVLEERRRGLEEAVRTGSEEGLGVEVFKGKGRGVIATKVFEKGDFVVEYSGELIDISEARRRETGYSTDHTAGCYMYYFKYGNQQYCIDATAETGRLGRLVNHSRNGNLLTRTLLIDGVPRLILVARDRILPGDEVTYDYGDRSKESLKHHPWLAF